MHALFVCVCFIFLRNSKIATGSTAFNASSLALNNFLCLFFLFRFCIDVSNILSYSTKSKKSLEKVISRIIKRKKNRWRDV